MGVSVVERIKDWLQLEQEAAPVEVREEPSPPPADYPRSWDEFIGQRELTTVLKAEVRAALQSGQPLGHLLLYGPPGVGKSCLAYVLAAELGDVPIMESTGAEFPSQREVLEAAGTVGRLLNRHHQRVIWLLDEADGLGRVASYPLHSLMVGGYIPYHGERFYGEGVTIIATTNRPAGVPRALRSRFAHSLYVEFYSVEELATIAKRAGVRKSFPISDDLAKWIGQSSAGEPRKALHLLRACRVLEATTPETARGALGMAGLREGGLSRPQFEYLRYLADVGGTAGLSTISAYLSLDRSDIQFDVEQFLLRSKMVMIDHHGRTITDAGRAYLANSLGATDRTDPTELNLGHPRG